MSDELTPGDVSVLVYFETTTKHVYQRLQEESPSADCKEVASAAIEATKLPEGWDLLTDKPEKTKERCHRKTAREFHKLKNALAHSVRQSGIGALDERSLRCLKAKKTKLEFGQWINHESRKVLEISTNRGIHSKKALHNALGSFGGLTTRDGKLFAIPVHPITGAILRIVMLMAGAISVWSAIAITQQFVQENCQPCVVMGAAVTFLLGLQVTHIVYEFGPKRGRCAKLLIEAGIPPFSNRTERGRFDFLQFIHLSKPSARRLREKFKSS